MKANIGGLWRWQVDGRLATNMIHLNRISSDPIKGMKKPDFQSMSLDDLWTLHEQISTVLSSRIVAEKQQLEERLVHLNRGRELQSAAFKMESGKADRERPRRKYPRVFPKYQNPAVPSETWSGRGKQPRWLVSALKAGRTIEDFQIQTNVRDNISA
jgi:DNA-binding protein H-NS